MTVDCPCVGKRNLAVVDWFVLVKYRLCRVHWEDEFFLVERKTSAKLVLAHAVVGVDLGVVLSLKDGTNDREVARGNVRRTRGGVSWGLTGAMHAERLRRVCGG